MHISMNYVRALVFFGISMIALLTENSLAAISLVGAADRTSNESTDTGAQERPMLVIEYFRSCGLCSAYTLTIFASGRAIYLGKDFVNTKGLREFKIDDGSLASIRNALNDLRIDQLDTSYIDKQIADGEVIEITSWRDGEMKRVRFRANIGTVGTKLAAFARFTGDLVDSKNWVCPVPVGNEHVCKGR
jgi:hypothetical protein